jgi:8-oxo-dGTP pyrophosphatase MutT (NUDIX family)
VRDEQALAPRPSPDLFTVEAFVNRAADRLIPLTAAGSAREPIIGGDHRLDDARPFIVDPTDVREAAVLMPIVARPKATMLLTERALGLPMHAGQVAFPGGRIEASETPVEAAVREAFEEIGLSPSLVTPLGALDPYLTSTGFRVTPIVALVDPVHSLALNPYEVADAFEAPLSFLMNPANHEVRSRQLRGKSRRFYAMPWQGHDIWGATAGMIRVLYERVYAR